MGGASFSAGGVQYTLRFSFGALCHFEDLADKSLVEALSEIQKMGENIRFKVLVPIIQAGLFDTHPDISERDVMSLEVDSVKVLIDAIGDAAQKAFPDEEKPKGNVTAGKKS